MIERLLLVAYGLVLISSLFLVGSTGRLIRREIRRWSEEGRSRDPANRFYRAIIYSIFWQSIALMIVGGIRVMDGFLGRPLGGSAPELLLFAMVMLWNAKAGFHWAVTIGRIRWQWRLYLFALGLWIVLVVSMAAADAF